MKKALSPMPLHQKRRCLPSLITSGPVAILLNPLFLLFLLALCLTNICIITYSASAQESIQDIIQPTAPIELTEESHSEKQVFVSDPLPSIPALPEEEDSVLNILSLDSYSASDLFILSLLGGAVAFALFTGLAFVRSCGARNSDKRKAQKVIQDLQARLDHAESLMNTSDHLMIVWESPDEPAHFLGGLNDHGALPQGLALLAFESWLKADDARNVEQALLKLRTEGQRFLLSVCSLSSQFVEMRGRTSGGRLVLQMRVLEGEEQDRAQVDETSRQLSLELERMKNLLDAVPMPVWSRNAQGRISWINSAYLEAVEGESIESIIKAQTELVDQKGRTAIEKAHKAKTNLKNATAKGAGSPAYVIQQKLPVVTAGERHIYDIVDIAAAQGSVGIAIDVTEADITQKALSRMQSFHANTLDLLATPVAIFNADQTIRFYNAAYCDQFKLDEAFLAQKPTDSAILDHLRANRRLPEQADYHAWKDDFLSTYHLVETQANWWHLPDGQALRVIATPNPDGGITYIFENVTEKLDLEKRYNALIRMQTETLNHLSDGVVVFGSDGRLRVTNPAFSRLWEMPEELLGGQPHASAVMEWCRRKYPDERVWTYLRGAITGLADKREGLSGRMECADERILDYASIPLPDGATMLTFVDVTDNVKVERGLVDRNEALMAADQLKNTFIQHVSYELRSPLTNIIGFTELLSAQKIGALNDRQREYTDHIKSSSSSLLAIVNDILDLATIDAGIMELDLGSVDPVSAICSAAEGLQDRLAEKGIDLNISVPEDMQAFIGDEKRVRQVLYNLISNAIAFSKETSPISVLADQIDNEIVFTIRDHGCGIPQEYKETAFDRFESRNPASEQRGGVGLGLSIVKSFVQLHGGSVSIRSHEDQGTEVVCRFPLEPSLAEQAAE